jgi:hypothetical protein
MNGKGIQQKGAKEIKGEEWRQDRQIKGKRKKAG